MYFLKVLTNYLSFSGWSFLLVMLLLLILCATSPTRLECFKKKIFLTSTLHQDLNLVILWDWSEHLLGCSSKNILTISLLLMNLLNLKQSLLNVKFLFYPSLFFSHTNSTWKTITLFQNSYFYSIHQCRLISLSWLHRKQSKKKWQVDVIQN